MVLSNSKVIPNRYHKTTSGLFFRCSCSREIKGGSNIYVPVYLYENSLEYGRAICEECYNEVKQ